MIIKKKIKPIDKKIKLNLTIGTFDALHIGHRKVLKLLTESSIKDRTKSCIITFENRPKHLLKKNDGIVYDNKERIAFFKRINIDHLFHLKFTEKFSHISANSFLKLLSDNFHLNKVIIGEDFRFGYKNKGDIKLMQNSKYFKDVDIIIVPAAKYKNKKISTTLIKSLLKKGKIQKVNTLLGHQFFIAGRVQKGAGLGQKIGFPTINLKPNNIHVNFPSNGVYVTKIKYNNTFYYSMTYIGTNHFIKKHVIETNIFNFNKKTYNKKISIFFIKKLRKEIKFIKLEDLKKQLLKDKNKAITVIEKINKV